MIEIAEAMEGIEFGFSAKGARPARGWLSRAWDWVSERIEDMFSDGNAGRVLCAAWDDGDEWPVIGYDAGGDCITPLAGDPRLRIPYKHKQWLGEFSPGEFIDNR